METTLKTLLDAAVWIIALAALAAAAVFDLRTTYIPLFLLLLPLLAIVCLRGLEGRYFSIILGGSLGTLYLFLHFLLKKLRRRHTSSPPPSISWGDILGVSIVGTVGGNAVLVPLWFFTVAAAVIGLICKCKEIPFIPFLWGALVTTAVLLMAWR
ncbi:MAG: hypothetical protein QW260_06130 [Thermoproteota archaeon]